jgi:hypothetical protein
LEEKYFGEGYFQLNRDLGMGFYLQGYTPVHVNTNGVIFQTKTFGDKNVTTMETPKGTLTQIQQYLPVSSSYGFIKHYVENAADLPAFCYYIENQQYTPNYEEAIRRKTIIGDNGAVLCYTPRSPFMQMVTTYSGLDNFIYLLADFPDEINDLLRVMENKYDIAAQLAVDSPAEFIMIPENLSSEAIGRHNYVNYLQPYERKWIESIKKAGKKSLIHMDGTLRGLIQTVAKTGFDIIEAVTPAPAGDMTMAELAETVRGSTILWGGLPGTVFTPALTEDEFEAHVIETLSVMKKEPRFVLGVADQVPPDGLLSRVKAVNDLCERFGKYDL